MAKPTRKPTWATDADPLNNIEPDTALQLSGVPLGGKIGRQHYNYLFGSTSEWVDWIQADAMDRTLNLNDLTDKPQARINLGASNASNLISGTIPSARLPNATITLNGDVSGSGVMTNLGSVTITTSIPSATTLVEGLVQLNDTTSSTSTTQAATANSVKITYDLANSKLNTDLSNGNAEVIQRAVGMYYVSVTSSASLSKTNIPFVGIGRTPGYSSGVYRVQHGLGSCVPTATILNSSATAQHILKIISHTDSYTDVAIISTGGSLSDNAFFLHYMKEV